MPRLRYMKVCTCTGRIFTHCGCPIHDPEGSRARSLLLRVRDPRREAFERAVAWLQDGYGERLSPEECVSITRVLFDRAR